MLEQTNMGSAQQHCEIARPVRGEFLMGKQITHLGGLFTGDEWFVAVNVLRHPKTGFPHLALTYKVFPNDTTIMTDGVDQPGVAAYLTANLERFGLSYSVCVGERGIHGQGTRFELPSTPDTRTRLRSMYEHIQQHPEEFKPRQPVEFDRLCNLAIRMPHDGCGLLTRATAYLADRNINMRYVRAEKDDLNKALGLHEVKVFAQLEVPGIDLEILETELRQVCPGKSEVKLRELWRRPTGGQSDEPHCVMNF